MIVTKEQRDAEFGWCTGMMAGRHEACSPALSASWVWCERVGCERVRLLCVHACVCGVGSHAKEKTTNAYFGSKPPTALG